MHTIKWRQCFCTWFFFSLNGIRIFCSIRYRKIKANNFLQLSHRWVIQGSSAGISQTSPDFFFFSILFEQTYTDTFKKNTQPNKNPLKGQLWVEGENLRNHLGVLDCEHKCQQTTNKPGCLVLKKKNIFNDFTLVFF